MKILHVTLNMDFGGAEKVIQHLIVGLASHGVQGDVVCIDDQIGPMGQALIEQGYSVTKLGRRPGIDFALIGKLRKMIRLGEYDVIHCHQYSPYLYGVLAAAMTSTRVIFTEHGRFYPDFGTWKRKLANRLFRLFTYRIVAISKATKQALILHENFPMRHIEVIYNGIEPIKATSKEQRITKSELGIPENNLVLGTISRLQPIKNQKLMIQALHDLHRSGLKCSLLIVGDGSEKGRLQILARSLGVEDSVVFTGYQLNPVRFHEIIDIFLLSSFSEGTSVTLLEAMALAKPCVVTNVGGNPEVVVDGETGIVAKSTDDSHEFADACRKLALDGEMRRRMGKSGLERFNKNFGLEMMLDRYLNLYSSQS